MQPDEHGEDEQARLQRHAQQPGAALLLVRWGADHEVVASGLEGEMAEILREKERGQEPIHTEGEEGEDQLWEVS